MTCTVNNPLTIYSLLLSIILLYSLPVSASAQSTGALVPPISLLLNDDSEPATEFLCDYSIANISPAPNSIIAENDSVSAEFSYTLRNRPLGIRIEVRPSLITSLEDLDNFQNTSSLSLTPVVTTLADFESTDADTSGTIALAAINDGTNIGLTGRTFNDLVVFITLSRQDADSGEIVVVGSGTFDCANRTSEAVNWTFTREN